jgi:[acyl-carrier-protein] S-malonyltransferase
MNSSKNNLAFVFPGQGSQSAGMLNQLAADYPEVKQVFEKASFVLGKDLWRLVSEGPEEELNQTQNTQPVMLAAGVAVWEIWCKRCAVRPAWMAGHSLGEYTALVCSGAIFFEDAVKLVATRAALMQEAVPQGDGAMAAILGLDDDKVKDVCANAANDEIVSAVNFNAPGQVVIAGHATAVNRAVSLAKDAGAKRAVLLPVSVPSHCSLMKPAAEKLEQYLHDIVISSPKIQIIHNADVETHNAPELIRTALKEQLYQPVRWVESVNLLSRNGVSVFVECGPGKVLTGLDKRIVKDADHLAINDSESFATVVEQLNG